MMGCFCGGSGLLLVVVMAGLSACAEVRVYIGCVVYVRMTERERERCTFSLQRLQLHVRKPLQLLFLEG